MRDRINLAVIDAPEMRAAIDEFNCLGRAQFLKHYGIARSSKFYLIFGQRLYDTKALVAAAYWHATRKTLHHTDFGGGAQTLAIFSRLSKKDSDFNRDKVFEDRLGELRYLSDEYDRIPRNWINLRELGFSKWIPIAKYCNLETGWLPGVYVIVKSGQKPHKIRIIDKQVIYIGETVKQDLHQRLGQFHRSLFKGKKEHSGGETLRKKGYYPKKLWLAIRSFPLAYRLDDPFAESFRSAQIRHLERMLLYEYVLKCGGYPPGNSK